MTLVPAVARDEAAEYYFNYIKQVPSGDIVAILRAQLPDVVAQLGGISEAQSTFRYAPEKWSVREVLGHINDCERLFNFRAFWFARGFDSELPSFDQDISAAGAQADQRSWADHVSEFRAIRAASLVFFEGLPPGGWDKRGIASGNPFTVRALAYIMAGHVTHHMKVLRERYKVGRGI